MTPLISIIYNTGIIDFLSSLVPIVIVDANPHFSQIVLKNQINGHVLRSSYLQRPNPISYTLFAGYEFQAQIVAVDNFIIKIQNCSSVEPLSFRYIGKNKTDNKQLNDSSLIKIDEAGLITVSSLFNDTSPSRVTFFVIYSNGLVIDLEYEFKTIVESPLNPPVVEADTFFCSSSCPIEYLMQYQFTD